MHGTQNLVRLRTFPCSRVALNSANEKQVKISHTHIISFDNESLLEQRGSHTTAHGTQTNEPNNHARIFLLH